MKILNRGTWEVLLAPIEVEIFEAVCKNISMASRKSDGFIVLKK
jgi:hypothetical protein